MSNSRHTTLFCGIIAALTLALTLLLSFAKAAGAIGAITRTLGYEAKLFDTSYVHSIDIVMDADDWQSFLERNYGELYKPDSISMGGGRGNGRDFDMQDFADENGLDFDSDFGKNRPSGDDSDFTPPDMPSGDNSGNGGFTPPDMPSGDNSGNSGFTPPGMPNGNNSGNGGLTPPGAGNMPDMSNMPGMNGRPNMGDMPGGFGGMGSSDVSLIYSDDEFESYSNTFDSAKTAITSKDKARLIASLKKLNANEDIEDVVDVEQVIRYFVVHNFVDNFDSYTGSMIHNYYLYEKDGKLSMIPWDYNLAFGGFMSGDATEMVNYPIDTPVSGGSVDSRPMLNWIFQSEEYTALYHSIMQEFIDSFFASGEFETLIDETYALIAPYARRDTNGFCTYAEFEQGVSTLKQFCLLRAESIQGQLDGTIPSTADSQSADGSALIDASSVTLSDMGSFGGGKAGFREQ